MQARVYTLIFLLLFVTQTWAQSTVGVLAACTQEKCFPNSSTSLLAQFSNQCAIESKALKCDELADEYSKSKDAEKLAGLIRKCDVSSLCEQAEEADAVAEMEACLRGYGNSLIDTGIALKDMVVGVGEQIDAAWEKIKADDKLRSEYVSQCNKSLSCKKDLVKDDPRYSSMSDEDLNKISATVLYVQAEDYKAYVKSMHRSVPRPPPEMHPKDNELTAEQKAKLIDLSAIIQAKLRKEYQKYNCYTPLAQKEMSCYAIGQVVDPVLLAGLTFKAARVVVKVAREIKSARELAKVEKAAEAAKSVANSYRGKFIEKYLKYNPTTPDDNKKYIELAKAGKSKDTYFMSVENSQMKYLNDTLKDKNLVTSITNFHKELMVTKLEELQKQYPGLIINMASDFKSLNIAFSGKIPPDLEKKLAAIYKDVTNEFAAYLKENKVIRDSDTPEKYFNAAFGTHNDETNVIMRAARDMNMNDKLASYTNPDVMQVVGGSLRAADIEREVLHSKYGSTAIFDGYSPSAGTFDIVRKYQDPVKLRAALEDRYKVDVSPSDVVRLRRYTTNVDSYSLNPFIEKRELANLNNAVHGGFSMDFVGLGSQNLKGTADALAKSDSVESALVNARSGEQAVTAELNKQKEFFNKITTDSVAPGKLKSVCSGDDCVAVAMEPLSASEKQKILNKVADSKYASKMRFSFVGEGVKSGEARNTLSTHGESIEKLLRKNLSNKISSDKLDSLTFGVDMRTKELNKGSIQLLVGQGRDLNLTKEEMARIRKVFKETVSEFNKTITYKDKPAARYKASP